MTDLDDAENSLILKYSGPFFFASVLFWTQDAHADVGMERIIGMSTALFVLMVVAAIPIRYFCKTCSPIKNGRKYHG